MKKEPLEGRKVTFRQWHTKHVYNIVVTKADPKSGLITGELLGEDLNRVYLGGKPIVMECDNNHIVKIVE
jgi:hypothetical protein